MDLEAELDGEGETVGGEVYRGLPGIVGARSFRLFVQDPHHGVPILARATCLVSPEVSEGGFRVAVAVFNIPTPFRPMFGPVIRLRDAASFPIAEYDLPSVSLGAQGKESRQFDVEPYPRMIAKGVAARLLGHLNIIRRFALVGQFTGSRLFEFRCRVHIQVQEEPPKVVTHSRMSENREGFPFSDGHQYVGIQSYRDCRECALLGIHGIIMTLDVITPPIILIVFFDIVIDRVGRRIFGGEVARADRKGEIPGEPEHKLGPEIVGLLWRFPVEGGGVLIHLVQIKKVGFHPLSGLFDVAGPIHELAVGAGELEAEFDFGPQEARCGRHDRHAHHSEKKYRVLSHHNLL